MLVGHWPQALQMLDITPTVTDSLWGNLITQLAHPVIDFLFNSQLKSIKNSVYYLDPMGNVIN